MDNQSLTDLFGQRAMTPVEEAWHKEQERKKYDIIRVKNPTAQDFYQKYDINQFQRIPANSTIDIPQYIAIRYVEHMKDKLIHEEAKRMHDAHIAEREAKGTPSYKSRYDENEDTYSSAAYPKTDDPKLIDYYYDMLWLGTVYEFGKDRPPMTTDSRSNEVNLKPASLQAIEKLASRRIAPEELDGAPISYGGTPLPTRPVDTIPTPPSGFVPPSQGLDQFKS